MVFKSFIPLGNTTRNAQENDTLTVVDHPIKLAIEIESPPCVLYGNATDSTGAILGGVLNVKVKDPYSHLSLIDDSVKKVLSGSPSPASYMSPNVTTSANMRIISGYTKITFESVTLTLVQNVHYNKPFEPNSQSINTCANCTKKVTTMKRWNIQNDPIDLSVGIYAFPFSCLIPGSVPSTSSLGANATTTISYELVAVANYKEPYKSSADFGKEQSLILSMPIAITRSIPRGPDRNSLRVFPPTELTAGAVLPNVVYPKSTFPLEMKIDGISSGDRRWRMRKLNWRIEETTRMRSNACNQHKHELKQIENATRTDEEEKAKKPQPAIKRYGDVGPQVRIAVGTSENTPLRRRNRNAGDSTVNQQAEPVQQIRAAVQGDQDDDDDDGAEFVHPSDDAMRQEIEQQQELVRERQIQQELKSDTTLFTEEIRIVSRGEMKSGWKTDFENNGHVELVTDIDCMLLNSGISNPLRYKSTARQNDDVRKQPVTIACDIQDPVLGVYISHVLAVEIVVAEEVLQYANGQPLKTISTTEPNSATSVSSTDQRLAELSPMFANRNTRKGRPVNSDDITPVDSSNGSTLSVVNKGSSPGIKIVSVPTGAARVLRCTFRLLVTERSGLGISWDDEVPPIYEDVKTFAPPNYDDIAVMTVNTTTIDNPPEPPLFSDGGFPLDSPIFMSQKIMPPPQARHHNAIHRINNNPKPPPFHSIVGSGTSTPFSSANRSDISV